MIGRDFIFSLINDILYFYFAGFEHGKRFDSYGWKEGIDEKGM